MAIILNNIRKTRAIIPSKEEINFIKNNGLCREATIKINDKGEVQVEVSPDSYQSGSEAILNLGFQGDNLVTLINIDTTELHWGDLANKGAQLNTAYQPILIFKDANNQAEPAHSIEFEGNYFLLPKSITDKATTYNIIFTLQERLEPNNGDVTGNL